jgi:hypothetical protein
MEELDAVLEDVRAGAHAVLRQGVRPAAGGAETAVRRVEVHGEMVTTHENGLVVRSMEVRSGVPQGGRMERSAGGGEAQCVT